MNQLLPHSTIEILLPLAFDHGFDYAVAEGMQVQPGDYVRVSFGRKETIGVVWGPGAGGIAPEKIKPIRALLAHLPPMSAAMCRYVDWVAAYTLAPRGNVLKMVMPLPDALEPPKMEVRYGVVGEREKPSPLGRGLSEGKVSTGSESLTPALSLREGGNLKPTPARLRIIAFLKGQEPQPMAQICEHAHVTPAVVRAFAEAGGLEKVESRVQGPEASYVTHDSSHSTLVTSVSFSPAQQTAIDTLRQNTTGFHPTLLDGVTGSGKTEVYFERIADVIRGGKQALVLLPEIALSVQWLTRFAKHFGFEPALWHSNVPASRKRKIWQSIAQGEAKVTVGARSALFLPYRNLSLIVVDEEHDHSYKQEDGVIYQARDMAVARAKEEQIPIILVSATPSLETTVNVEQKRYGLVHLPARFADAQLPEIRLVDMRAEKLPARLFLSSTLKKALADTLAQGGQAMLFLNRRGYAPLVLCNDCGHRFQCPECTTWLVLHKGKGDNSLTCHHCGYRTLMPQECPSCRAQGSLRACGPGVERIHEEVRDAFPQARIGVMTSEISESGGELAGLVDGMEKGKLDILIGTQMIAKGHHFAQLALVGVIDADMGLAGGDLRAGERTYQLLHQLAGRAGREKRKGEVLIQSYMPDHPVMQALVTGQRDAFMAVEARMREDAGMPPFGRLAAVIVEGSDEAVAHAAAEALARAIPGTGHLAFGIRGGQSSSNAQCPMPNPQILGPAPAPLFKLRGKTRYRFLVKSPRNFNLQNYVRAWLSGVALPRSVRVKVDVDPYSFL